MYDNYCILIEDFSDSLVKRRRRGYGGGAYVLELIGTDFGQPETAEQKFNRLHHEINELSEQLQSIKASYFGLLISLYAQIITRLLTH